MFFLKSICGGAAIFSCTNSTNLSLQPHQTLCFIHSCFLHHLRVSGRLSVSNICLLNIPNLKQISIFTETLYTFSVSSNPPILVVYLKITIIQDPSSLFKTLFYISSIDNLIKVSILHILGKSIQLNNTFPPPTHKIFKLLIYLKTCHLPLAHS